RVDGFDLVTEEARQAFGISHGKRGADPDRLDAVVDKVEEQIETFCALSLGLQGLAELYDELLRIAGDRLGGGDGFREIAAYLDEVGGANRVDRPAGPSHRLIEAAAKRGAETQGERRPRLVGKFADALEAEDAQIRNHVSRQTKGRNRQTEDRLRALSRQN